VSLRIDILDATSCSNRSPLYHYSEITLRRNSRRHFIYSGTARLDGKLPLGILHSSFALTGPIAGPEASLGGVIGLISSRVITGSIEFGLQVDGVHYLIVLLELLH
jgi:hypothetical protein